MKNPKYEITAEDIANESTLHSMLEYFNGRPRFFTAAHKASLECEPIHNVIQDHLDNPCKLQVERMITGYQQGWRSHPESIKGYSWWLVVNRADNSAEEINVDDKHFGGYGDSGKEMKPLGVRTACIHPIIDAGKELADALNVPLGTFVCGVRYWVEGDR